jgi:hypothetical protein
MVPGNMPWTPPPRPWQVELVAASSHDADLRTAERTMLLLRQSFSMCARRRVDPTPFEHTVSFVVRADGRAALPPRAEPDDSLAACVDRVVSRIVFPAPTTADVLRHVTLRFHRPQ